MKIKRKPEKSKVVIELAEQEAYWLGFWGENSVRPDQMEEKYEGYKNTLALYEWAKKAAQEVSKSA